MRINYTGKLGELTPDQRKKLDGRFAKLAKLLDSGEEQRQAHVIVKTERHLTKAEITVHYYGNEIVGKASDADPYSAMTDAAHNLETQVLKLRKKWIDSKRGNGKALSVEPAPAKPPAPKPAAKSMAKARVYRPRVAQLAKPMTAEEAVLSAGKKDAYVLFRDPDSDTASLLVRRDDGHFDLIEM
jgi:ribosomal subunit interface protein